MDPRELVKRVIGMFLRWKPLRDPKPGFSIVISVPWELRNLLALNLQFVDRTDKTELDRVYLVFDRAEQPGGAAFIDETARAFPGLPLHFQFQRGIPARIVRRINQSKFYCSTSWTLGLAECRTRYAILHDFDLYPVVPEYFAEIYRKMRDDGLHFSGTEYSHFDGLTDADNVIGTWALGIDVEWLRANYRPIDCYHRDAPVNGRRVYLDPFSYVELQTPRRAVVTTLPRRTFSHVVNLCSTYLRFHKGEPVVVAWRLHYLWYLESLSGRPERLGQVTAAMRDATTSHLSVGDYKADFSKVEPTCANVLRNDVHRLETSLFGHVRPEASAFVEGFADFLNRCGAHASPSQPTTSAA
jgi:hypothetical protein